MANKYPGYQNMISQDSPEVIRKRHEKYLTFRNATVADCRIENMEEITYGLEYRQGYRCRFQLVWFSGKGYQVYNQHTGWYVPNPDEIAEPCPDTAQ